MADAIYTTLGRQAGLLREITAIAQNVANASTTGYRASGLIFSEHVVDRGMGRPSVSIARAGAQLTDLAQGALEPTGGTFDLAIEGEGFFLVDRGGQERLTRAGAFVRSADGTVTTREGDPLLDAGGAPVVVPAGAEALFVAPDGTLSADGAPVAQIAVVLPQEPGRLRRAEGTLFEAPEGHAPAPAPTVVQGYLEASNVDPVLEIARMVAVQNAYALGQSFMETEDQRLRSVTRLLEQ
jgi:flagellar basal-body rod protein FlgF